MKDVFKKVFVGLFCVFMSAGHNEAKQLDVLEIQGNSVTLHGRLNRGNSTGIASVPSAPELVYVAVEQNPGHVEVSFQATFGNLCITVTNRYGYPVYQGTVNAVNGGSVLIDTQAWSAGTYAIQISDLQGGYLTGTFRID